jgi:hypothetical protein
MMRRYLWGLLLLIPFASTGCGGDNPRLDAATGDTLNASIKKMTTDMSESQKKQFKTECMAVAIAAAGKDKPPPATEAELYKPLQGMSVDDIHEKSEAVRLDVKQARKK